jgi:hypothetical protein
MKMKKLTLLLSICAIIIATTITACKKEEKKDPNQETADKLKGSWDLEKINGEVVKEEDESSIQFNSCSNVNVDMCTGITKAKDEDKGEISLNITWSVYNEGKDLRIITDIFIAKDTTDFTINEITATKLILKDKEDNEIAEYKKK